MADRPQVPGWNNINLNKPEEYSSEFVVDGNRYANVTNVTTGQRQLYYVQPLSNARGLLTTTTADGKVTKGGNYDNFIQFQGKDKLTNAEKANKQQSVKLLTTPGIATEKEIQAIKDSKEFKSTAAGQNSATTPEGQNATAAIEKDLKDLKRGTRYKKGDFRDDLRYPENLQLNHQDVVEFRMLSYEKRSVSEGANEGLGSYNERSKYTSRTIGRVVLPIPAGITDTNAVTWGSDTLTAFEKGLSDIANSIITEGGDAGADTAENKIKGVSENSGEIKSALAPYFAGQAIGKANLLSRTQGAVQNPNMELLFSGPTLRPFGFTFKLSARGTKDREQIRQIIRFFKQGMAVQRTASQLFLKAPNTFKIRYLHKSKDHPYINLIKECALQSFTVNYTPEGNYMTFADGLMTSYEITMQFQELEPIFNDDYTQFEEDNNLSRDAVIGY